MITILRDLRYSVRVLAKNSSFTIIAALTLGLGVGANSAIFSAVHAVLMRPLPFKNPDELARIISYNRSGVIGVSSWKELDDWRQSARSFEKMAVYRPGQSSVISPDGPEEVGIAEASAGFFELLGVNPILGRTFLRDDEGRTGKNRVVILGEEYWKRRFGGDPNILERLITVDDYNTRIIGVVPDRFKTLVGNAQVWFPWPYEDEPRDNRRLPVIGRLKPGVSIAQADSEMKVITSNLAQSYPETNREISANVKSLKDSIVGDVDSMLLILTAAVGMVLLIACANVTNLLLARASARSQEVAIRSALGASRNRLVRQFLTESCLLAILGAVIALFLASIAIKILILLNPGDIPRLDEIRLDGNVVAFTILLSLGSTLIFGLMPALRLSKIEFNGMLKEISRGIKGNSRQASVRNLLVIAEIAISLMVLIGAGLLMRSFYQLISTSPGFKVENLMTATVRLPDSRYPTPESLKLFYNQLVTRINSLPGAQSSALCNTLPLSGSGVSTWRGFVQEGRVYNSDERIFAQIRQISHGYLKTMQIPLLAGRDFNESDGDSTQRVIIISQSMARKVWPDSNPIGKRIIFAANGPSFEIVGLVGDIKRGGLDDPDDVAGYVPLAKSPSRFLVIVTRSASGPTSVVGPIKDMVGTIDKSLPIANVETMDHFLAATLAKRQFSLVLFSILAGLALLLAAIGTYGVVSYSVAERTQEIGVRMALGATRSNILFLVIGQAARLTSIGVFLGLTGAFASTRLLESFLFKVGATDPVVLAIISIFLLLVSIVAASLPAIKATRVDPMLALRSE